MSETVRLAVRAGVPVERVWRALTEQAEVRAWLAEEAEVDLPTRFTFGGRQSPGGEQRVLAVVDGAAGDRGLTLGWDVGGEQTTVEFRLVAEGGSTQVHLAQSHFPGWEAAVAEEGVLAWLYTFWVLALCDLVDHVEGREVGPRPDFTPGLAEFRAEVLIRAPRPEVAASLVEPERYERWFGAKVDIEPWPGGRFAMGGSDLDPSPGQVAAYEPDRMMRIAWGRSTHTWELSDAEEGTTLVVTQSGFDPDHPPHGEWSGWLGGLAGLRRYHELPNTPPIWLPGDVPGLPEGMLTD
ncbi:SRPBCC family protein [Actinosynnema pretiosum]|uniref:ATPase n=1 Tax=Actinosynnema pretiosum TaxID=42197 RepID=A0A290Z473_9PSEU|nr:SRPBCC domain-containing protein [Actinosynnema pretiosum]ATE53830.1 ATPase [Actinosynnema pretiosum]